MPCFFYSSLNQLHHPFAPRFQTYEIKRLFQSVNDTIVMNAVCEKFDFKRKAFNSLVFENASLCEVKINTTPKKEMLLNISCVV